MTDIVIPIIDLSPILGDETDLAKQLDEGALESLSQKIFHAMSQVGFMYLVNHGVPESKIEALFKHSEKFFNLPMAVKDKYEIDITKGYIGYTKQSQEILSTYSHEFRESIAGNDPDSNYTVDEVPHLMSSMEDLRQECEPLLRKLLRLLAVGLKLEDRDFFVKCHSAGSIRQKYDLNVSPWRVNYYSPIPEDVDAEILRKAIRCAEHTDYGTLTFLFQDDIGGLEVKTTNGKWIPATPIPNSILVNTADALEIWTKKLCPATFHRVVIPEKEILRRDSRMSFTYFVWPDSDTLLTPIKSELMEARRSNGDAETEEDRPILFKEHFEQKMYGSYSYIPFTKVKINLWSIN